MRLLRELEEEEDVKREKVAKKNEKKRQRTHIEEEGKATQRPEEKTKQTVLEEKNTVTWKRIALLLLPSYFSAPNLVTRTLTSKLCKFIGLFTIASDLEEAISNSDYETIQQHVQNEWLKVGGLLVGLAALEAAVFALSPGSLFPIDSVARVSVSGSSISTGAGLLCDACLLLRFSMASVPVFKYRAQDTYEVHENGSVRRTESYVFFALVARLPLLLAAGSLLFIVALLTDVAFKLSPLVVLAIVSLTTLMICLQYICWVLIWMVFGLSKVVGWIVLGLSKAATLPMLVFKHIVAKTSQRT
ncbi:hypothetical protein B0H16DRAFT_220894 [Mycena metata]|uniref:Uncharacterized protein n=1 Tax=Mycena metata TaxID=1033252 RepID=A0AAD7MSQ0_9AGAR|nr:hypothetical protein B0H16DRAFT_220894 [Mycena metata]